MRTTELKFNVPEEIFYSLNETKFDFVKKMKLFTAIEFYKLGKLSLVKSALLAELNLLDFMQEISKLHIPVINYDEDDFRDEIERIMIQ
jgi:predicted HTH domain antitoxin